jgi:hypothetical protein
VAMLAIYEEISKFSDKDVIATDILPEVWKLSVDSVLNVTQFKKFMKVIRELTDRVESQQTKFLEEIKSLQPSAETNAPDFETLVKSKPIEPPNISSMMIPVNDTLTGSIFPLSGNSIPVQNSSFSNNFGSTPCSSNSNNLAAFQPLNFTPHVNQPLVLKPVNINMSLNTPSRKNVNLNDFDPFA